MHKKFEINRKKIKGGCQSGRKVVTHNSKSDLPLIMILCNNKLPFDPEITRPNSAEITTQLTGWSCPVKTALGVGCSASPTIL